jgi:hypothetical protein
MKRLALYLTTGLALLQVAAIVRSEFRAKEVEHSTQASTLSSIQQWEHDHEAADANLNTQVQNLQKSFDELKTER